MTTSIWSGRTSNSQCASMTSKPLFTSVAESIVMLRPMRQLGCASACSGVAAAISRERRLAKRAAGSGQDELLHFAMAPGAQALVDRVVFAIHGKQFDVGLARGGHHDFAGGDQDFFVRKRDLLPCLHGGVRGFKADDAHGCGNQQLRRRDAWRRRASRRDRAESPAISPVPAVAQTVREVRGQRGTGNRNEFGVMAHNLLRQFFDVVSGGQRHDAEALGHGFHDGKRLPADRSRRTENGNCFKLAPLRAVFGFPTRSEGKASAPALNL